MTSSDLPEQGDPADGRQCLWTAEYSARRPAEVIWDAPSAEALISTAKHCGYVVRGPYVPLERVQRAEAEVKRLREAALAVVLTWDNEGSQHGIMSALREAVGYPPERPTREEAKTRLNAYLGLPNDPGENR